MDVKTKLKKEVTKTTDTFDELWNSVDKMLSYSLNKPFNSIVFDGYPWGSTLNGTKKLPKSKVESDGSTTITIDVPGFEKEEIKLHINNKVLYIEAKNIDETLNVSEYIGDVIVNSVKLKNGQLKVNYKPKQPDKGTELKITEE